MEPKVKKSKLMIMIISLVVMNILTLGTLWFFYINDPGHGPEFRKRQIIDFMQNKMQFSNEQNDMLTKMRDEHFKIKNALFDSIHVLKRLLIDEIMKEPTDTLAIKSISDKIGNLFSKNEFDFAMHFIKIKGICNSNQKKQLREFLGEISEPRRFDMPGPPPGRAGGHAPFH